jgi:nicotinate phosphoribosyltransferase
LRSHRNSAGDRSSSPTTFCLSRRARQLWRVEHAAIPEGRVVHPNTPLTIVRGPMIMAQILETPLLNRSTIQTLIATKAARMVEASRGGAMLEFGLRRAQDEGANAGTRAALIGGAVASVPTSARRTCWASRPRHHAHSMVQLMMALGEGEIGAFRAYAELYPDDCLLLVDTVDTLQSGVPNAIRVFEELRRKGHKPVGIRLDSGDLAYLSIQARECSTTPASRRRPSCSPATWTNW